MAEHLLIVEDEDELRDRLRRLFVEEGYSVDAVPDGETAIRLYDEGLYDAVITDIILPGIDGIELLRRIKERSHEQSVIIMTAFASLDTAVKALKAGAYDYLIKPLMYEEIKQSVRNALREKSLRTENVILKKEIERRYDFGKIIGDSPEIRTLIDDVRKVSDSRSNVLLLGETGTGKELFARAIHYNSSRKDKPFIPINCSAIPENLLESELFGYNKGAYTGAETDKQGLIEIADKGTLFLDEIGDMPLSLQSKLFRFLDQRSFRPLGSTKEKNVSLNLICATCLDIEKQVGEEKFRKDLFFRISVIPITIPPLRQRDKDVLELASFYLAEFSKRLGKSATSFTEDVKDVFMTYWWPGNVRELRNLIERILILKDNSDNMVRLADLPAEMFEIQQQTIMGHTAGHLEGESLSHTMDRIEREMIVSALARCMGSRTQTAAELGISRFSLLRRMQRHGLE